MPRRATMVSLHLMVPRPVKRVLAETAKANAPGGPQTPGAVAREVLIHWANAQTERNGTNGVQGEAGKDHRPSEG
jgi:hypothetical protein